MDFSIRKMKIVRKPASVILRGDGYAGCHAWNSTANFRNVPLTTPLDISKAWGLTHVRSLIIIKVHVDLL